ncbi:helix-turn-helix domain-containing protein [Anaerostipes sp. MSJ-23]|uniref:helix-turn-helix domain-containing protein n=1 Tax=Anaerostipes sp. MSJ-23 TaxID=2841520 RepID=UPI001C0F554F|nr:helix-turn-helix transcriptional regulator [Anaerostipes sp. MSJ-23]MBU5460443.1 helix-turn-helix domain-containing protein [Anaerostipes sp. MSJ-23]
MENLKVLRKAKHLSQQKLADILHISQQSVYKYENDITSPDIETLTNMSDFFDTSIDYLVGNTDISRKIENVSPNDLNKEETHLVENYRQLPTNYRKLIQALMDEYLNILNS